MFIYLSLPPCVCGIICSTTRPETTNVHEKSLKVHWSVSNNKLT